MKSLYQLIAEKKDYKVFELGMKGIFTLPDINLNDEQEKENTIEVPYYYFLLQDQ